MAQRARDQCDNCKGCRARLSFRPRYLRVRKPNRLRISRRTRFSAEKIDGETRRIHRRCFVLCRTAMQFRKFARFDPKGAPLDDTRWRLAFEMSHTGRLGNSRCRKSTRCVSRIRELAGNERCAPRSFATKYRPWLAHLLSNRKLSNDFRARLRLYKRNPRSTSMQRWRAASYLSLF